MALSGGPYYRKLMSGEMLAILRFSCAHAQLLLGVRSQRDINIAKLGSAGLFVIGILTGVVGTIVNEAGKDAWYAMRTKYFPEDVRARPIYPPSWEGNFMKYQEIKGDKVCTPAMIMICGASTSPEKP
jgi:hypothetical protein